MVSTLSHSDGPERWIKSLLQIKNIGIHAKCSRILPLSDVIHWTGFFPSISMIIQMATKGHDSDQAILLSFVRPSPLFLM
jgi:hypothetical protein